MIKFKYAIAVTLVSLAAALCFACGPDDGGKTVAALESSAENMIVMKITQTDGNATALDALTMLRDGGKLQFEYSDGAYGAYITSINGKAEQSSGSSGYSWMLYTSDAENSSVEFGKAEYNGVEYGQAAVGASSLKVKEGELYIWVYESWSF